MTEEEWLASNDARIMAEWARDKLSSRKYQLLNCSCCRCLAAWFIDDRLAKCLGRAEGNADGLLKERTFTRWGVIADTVGRTAYGHSPAFARAGEAVRALFTYRSVSYPAHWDAWRALCIDQAVFAEPFSSGAAS